MNAHQRTLQRHAEELVSRYGRYQREQYYLSLDELPDHEQDELARLFMESTNRETSECVYGDDFSINSEFTCALLAMLQNNCPNTRNRFAEVTRNNVLVYYRKSLDEVLNDACNGYLHSMMNEQGLYAEHDMHGDMVWV